jgi:hypothetical protein
LISCSSSFFPVLKLHFLVVISFVVTICPQKWRTISYCAIFDANLGQCPPSSKGEEQ